MTSAIFFSDIFPRRHRLIDVSPLFLVGGSFYTLVTTKGKLNRRILGNIGAHVVKIKKKGMMCHNFFRSDIRRKKEASKSSAPLLLTREICPGSRRARHPLCSTFQKIRSRMFFFRVGNRKKLFILSSLSIKRRDLRRMQIN